MSDPRDERPEAPPPATWAGRERSSPAGPPPSDEGGVDGPAPGVDEQEVEQESDADELEREELADELQPDEQPGPESSQDTVEADTPTLADREAAREAALAGIRARTAEHAANRGAGTSAGTAPPPPAEAPAADEAAPEAQPVAAAEPEPPAEPPAPPVADLQPEGAPRRGLWPRFLAGSLVIIVAMTTATAVSLLVYLKGIARGLGGLPSVQSQLEVADPGNPQTILILGSDQRPTDASARSDTTILLRVAAEQITVLSIPRDLKVNIPGHGVEKINAAYEYGGPALTLKTVKRLTGLNINHVINVTFKGFWRAARTRSLSSWR